MRRLRGERVLCGSCQRYFLCQMSRGSGRGACWEGAEKALVGGGAPTFAAPSRGSTESHSSCQNAPAIRNAGGDRSGFRRKADFSAGNGDFRFPRIPFQGCIRGGANHAGPPEPVGRFAPAAGRWRPGRGVIRTTCLVRLSGPRDERLDKGHGGLCPQPVSGRGFAGRRRWERRPRVPRGRDASAG
jgi:hypothetical protein